jgi:hypothetical protein
MTRRTATLSVLTVVCLAGTIRADDPRAAFFENKIRPVLVDKCYSCHDSTGKKQRGGLSLDTKAAVLKGGDSGPSLVVGKPGESLIIKALTHSTPDLKMPPKGKLPETVIADFSKWIADGAFDPRDGSSSKTAAIDFEKGRQFWSFRPVTSPTPPEVKNSSWIKTPIDRFVLDRLEREGLTPVKAAGRIEWIRRVTFDLIGLPPTPSDIETFVADGSDDAFAKVVDRLLASPHFGERWARQWLDVARYAEDQAHTFGVKPNTNAYRYRDWVVAALNSDMPYDRFVQMQIAADLVEMPDAERLKHLPALGFFGLGAQYYKNTDAAKAAADELDDRVDTLSRGFLGLTVSCARCHDHKFDPIPQIDYYSLAGIFQSCKISDVALAPAAEVKHYNEGQAKLKKVENEQKAFMKAEKAAIAEAGVSTSAKALLAAWRFQVDYRGPKKMAMNAFAANESLSADALGRWVKFLQAAPKSPALESCRVMFQTNRPEMFGEVEAAAKDVQWKLEQAVAAKKANKASKEQNELLKVFLGEKGPLEPTDEEVKAQLSAEKKAVFDKLDADISSVKNNYPQTAPPMAHGLAETTGKDMPVFLRGNPAKPGEVAPRRFIQVIAKDAATFTSGSGRLELAAAIIRPDNPLTARVIVNRLWQGHFGRGIVGTPSNFGELGERPTHPELLDYLATRLMREKWSLKAIHREIVLSATYQLRCDGSTANEAKDAGNRLLWRHDRRRLDIESWRDAMLAVSGQLDLSVGGQTFDLNNTSVHRRTLYAKISRHDLNATLRLFDYPDANITSEKRSETTVPQQQLFTLNSAFVAETAKAFAKRLQSEAADDDGRVRRAFLLAFGRQPTDEERAISAEFLSGGDPTEGRDALRLTRLERFAQVVLAGNEFAFVD